MTTNKNLIWIGVASALLIGGGFAWWYYASKSNKEEEEKDPKNKGDENTTDDGGAVKTDTGGSGTGGGGTGTGSSGGGSKPKVDISNATPFKNDTEGNMFRAWMAKKHNDYRFWNGVKNDILDSSGMYDNATIRDAFAKYGKEYMKTIPSNTGTGNSNTTTNSSDYYNMLYAKRDGATVYSVTMEDGKVALDKKVGATIKDARIAELKGDITIGGLPYYGFDEPKSGANVGKRRLIAKSEVVVKKVAKIKK